jgi:WD40 repeat protein
LSYNLKEGEQTGMASAISQSQPSSLPVATPRYIFRGHKSSIHALHIFDSNALLVSADADGWIVIWSLVTKRPVAVWKAHEAAVLEVKGFTWKDDTKSDDSITMEIFTYADCSVGSSGYELAP